ncbi:MAG: hypothetical protein PHE29_11515 [Tissierellia bacterium]|nr:hypothetical protein [Tissierellia bacterium]
MANTFTSLIKCSCGQNYRYIKERKKPKYLCQGYAKKLSDCERNILDEKLLLDIVQIYCNRNKIELIKSNEFMKSIIDKINIDENHNIVIEYKNGEKGIFKNNSVHI